MKCSDVYTLFFEPGEVTEIRAFGERLREKDPTYGMEDYADKSEES